MIEELRQDVRRLMREEITRQDEIIKHITEYLNVMKDEPDEYILLSKVYHDLRRILGDE